MTIELVIKIPEEEYSDFCKRYIGSHNIVINAVCNGVQLPKGHGRLIDADALDKSLEKEQEDLDNDELSNAFGDGLTWASEVLSKESTIIEADKENEK